MIVSSLEGGAQCWNETEFLDYDALIDSLRLLWWWRTTYWSVALLISRGTTLWHDELILSIFIGIKLLAH
ncbi:hypothetical protein M6B38_185695 [Iris pallida]|uniref:Uncharacterized protein n=1 Tax=Iris pallida TaxID=29817 RepID=A0AAX6EJR4_IRIPA|nr:hypothetical protein M6B38_185695 [Iris pallida]